MTIRTLTAGTLLGLTVFVLIVFILSLTEAGASELPLGLQRDLEINAAEQCAHKVTGLPIAQTPAKVIFSPLWTTPPDGMCCNVDGQRAYKNSRVLSKYSPLTRTITLYAAAGFPQLVHEIAADMWAQQNNRWQYKKWEKVGYEAEWEANSCEERKWWRE